MSPENEWCAQSVPGSRAVGVVSRGLSVDCQWTDTSWAFRRGGCELCSSEGACPGILGIPVGDGCIILDY